MGALWLIMKSAGRNPLFIRASILTYDVKAYILSETEQTIQIGLTYYKQGLKMGKAHHRILNIKALRAYDTVKNNGKIATELMSRYQKESKDNKRVLYSSVARTARLTRG